MIVAFNEKTTRQYRPNAVISSIYHSFHGLGVAKNKVALNLEYRMSISEQIFRVSSIVVFGLGFSLAVSSAREALTPETLSTFIDDIKSVEVAHKMNTLPRAEYSNYTLAEPNPNQGQKKRLDPSDILSQEVK